MVTDDDIKHAIEHVASEDPVTFDNVRRGKSGMAIIVARTMRLLAARAGHRHENGLGNTYAAHSELGASPQRIVAIIQETL